MLWSIVAVTQFLAAVVVCTFVAFTWDHFLVGVTFCGRLLRRRWSHVTGHERVLPRSLLAVACSYFFGFSCVHTQRLLLAVFLAIM